MRIAQEILALPRAVAPGEEIVAIGDIHGRPDLLHALLDAAAAAPREAPTRRLVFTGDLNDRGPDTLGAFALAAQAGARIGAAETVGLMGNHEILMRLTLDPDTPEPLAREAAAVWLGNGGEAVAQELLGPGAARLGASALVSALRFDPPPPLLRWLGGLRSHDRSGEVLFIHAGVNPALALADTLALPWDQPPGLVDEKTHWAWVRAPFLRHRPGADGHFGLFVVHGHTPLDKGYTRSHDEQVERFRLNLDGGSANTGVAKMAILRGGVAEIFTVCGEPG